MGRYVPGLSETEISLQEVVHLARQAHRFEWYEVRDAVMLCARIIKEEAAT